LQLAVRDRKVMLIVHGGGCTKAPSFTDWTLMLNGAPEGSPSWCADVRRALRR